MLPAGNLRRPETWEAFFQADRKAEVKSSKLSQSLGRRAPSRDLSQPKRTPSADRTPPSVFSSPPATAPHRARSPKAVKHIPPLKVEEDTPVPTSLPPSPVKTRTSSVPLRPHTARSRAVYEGPPVRFMGFACVLCGWLDVAPYRCVQCRDPVHTRLKPRSKPCQP